MLKFCILSLHWPSTTLTRIESKNKSSRTFQTPPISPEVSGGSAAITMCHLRGLQATALKPRGGLGNNVRHLLYVSCKLTPLLMKFKSDMSFHCLTDTVKWSGAQILGLVDQVDTVILHPVAMWPWANYFNLPISIFLRAQEGTSRVIIIPYCRKEFAYPLQIMREIYFSLNKS